ncbi:alpha/beta hydrolase [Sandaracinus amylolyticus]|uniref:alpha/beta hydrolase n=1 Tax=Sandaracinus amylolyticus TaxID=927083 RepID=UPI001F3CEE8C|nr:dienelactone hydrolase family protein [Sandaracinus amylolyticus]UJR81854.1 Phospholipase/Carboxylesterase [Sandaracinus amylolyticus]
MRRRLCCFDFVALLITLAVLSACGASPPRPTQARQQRTPPAAWPPPSDPPVPTVPPVAEQEAPLPEPIVAASVPEPSVPLPPPTPREHYQARAPGVRVREGESQGIGFLEIVLGDVDPNDPLPMIVVLHGRGDRPRVPGGPFEGLTHPVRVIMPRGPMIVGEGFGWLPVRVMEGQTELLAAGLRDVSTRLSRLIEEVRASRPTIGPTMVSGFSQGGMLAITLAVRYPTLVGVAFPLAGWLPPPLWPELGPPAGAAPIRAMHARDDERIPFEPVRESYDRLRTLGWDLQLSTYEGVGHSMSAEMDATFHAWLERALAAIARGESRLVEPLPAPDVIEEERPRVRARRSRREARPERRPRARRPGDRPRRPASPRRRRP